MKFNFPVNNFSSGEWSPKMLARTDTEQYFRACESLKNVIVQMQGGAFRRPGTAYIDVTATFQAYLDSTAYKVIPIVLSTGGRYVLVCPAEAPDGANKWFVVNTATNFCTVVTPSVWANFADSQIDKAHFAQIGDTVWISNSGVAPRYLQFDGTNWNLVAHWEYFKNTGDQWKAFPFGPVQALGIQGTITVTGTFTVGGTVTLTSSLDLFHSDHIKVSNVTRGLHVKLTKSSTTGVVEVTAFTNTKVVTATVVRALPGASGDAFGLASGTAFELSSWNGFDGYPRAIVPYQGRLLYGGNSTFPDTLWGSRIGNVFDFMEVPYADDPLFSSFAQDNSRPFSLKPNAAESSNIMALSSAKTVVINSSRSEIVAYGVNGALGPNDFQFESSTSFGAERVQPARINNYLTFVQRGYKKLRDVIFSFQENQYKSNDLSFVAEHLTSASQEEIVEIMPAELLSSVLFCRTYKGKLRAVTLDRDYQVNAWAPLDLGGAYQGANGTYPEVLGMAAVPGGTLGQDDVYFLVRRTINGATKTYLEHLSSFFEYPDYDGTFYPFPRFMDCCLQVSNSPAAATFTGITHLAGETVQVLADGVYLGEFVVDASGNLVLPAAYTTIIVGYKYKHVVRPLPVEQGGQFGSPLGLFKRVQDITIKFYKSVGAKYKIVGQADEFTIDLRDPTTPSNARTPLFTGAKKLKLPPGISEVFQVEVSSELPFPCNVLSITMQGVTND